jgi:hypothetical protein
MCWCWGIQSLPIDTRDEPLPLGGRERTHRRFCGGPDEMPTMQTAMTQPDAGAIPSQELDPGSPMIVKGVGAAVARRATQGVLDALRQTIYAGTHVDGFND